MTTTLLDEVRAGWHRGWRFTPVRNKRPQRTAWQKEEPADLETTLRWASEGDVGIRTGLVSGVVIVDVDSETLPSWLPATVMARTPGGGYHLYYASPAEETPNKGAVAPHVDVRGDGGQAVFVGSQDGKYRWEVGHSPTDRAIVPYPAELLQRSKQGDNYAQTAFRNEVAKVAETLEGSKARNTTLNQAAFALGQFVAADRLDKSDVVAALLRATSLPHYEAVRTIESGLSAGMRSPRTIDDPKQQARKVYRLTDLGNAERMADTFPGKYLWSSALGLHYWTGCRYAPDETREAYRDAGKVIRDIRAEAKKCTDTEVAEAMEKHATKSEGKQRLDAMITLLEGQPSVAIHAARLDANPYLFNMMNGTFDFESMAFRDHDPNDYITKLANVAYDPHADCEKWREFLYHIFDGDDELITYIQMALGTCCTGVMRDQLVHFCYGTGQNGKGVLLNTIHWLLGSYAVIAPEGLLTKKDNGASGQPNEVMRLKGARLAWASESGEGKRLDEERVKRLSGDDILSGRHLYKEFLDFAPTHKLWVACNHRPVISGTDFGIWRRVRVIPFTVTVSDEDVNPRLKDELQAEASGIFNWLVDGVANWRAAGERLPLPEKVKAANDEYRTDSDLIGGWIDECCEICNGCSEVGSKLYESYRQWARENGMRELSSRNLGRRLSEKGYVRRKTHGQVLWDGLRVAMPY